MKKFDKNERRAMKIVNAPKKPKLFGDDRDKPDYDRPRSTMPARQRDGKTYAGGRRLRRALSRLAIEQKGCLAARAAAGKQQGGKSKSEQALQMPGAMKP